MLRISLTSEPASWNPRGLCVAYICGQHGGVIGGTLAWNTTSGKEGIALWEDDGA
jgi:hypothetical protein